MINTKAVTNRNNALVYSKIDVDIIEVVDKLFCKDNALMLPGDPEIADHIDQMPGIRALTLVLKQFQADSNKRMVITGHSNNQLKSAEFHYSLSKARAECVLYLLNGHEDKWAQIIQKNHTRAGYKKLITFFSKVKNFGCETEDFLDSWNDKVAESVRVFIKAIADEDTAKKMVDEIKNEPNNKWPESLWVLVYREYIKLWLSYSGLDAKELVRYRNEKIKFITDDGWWIFRDDVPVVACGCSAPLSSLTEDDKKDCKYLSVDNRRVEMLFFDKSIVIDRKCPKNVDALHTKKECPLWHTLVLNRHRVPEDEVEFTAYHLQFRYYNKTKNEILNVQDIIEKDAAGKVSRRFLPVCAYEENSADPNTPSKIDTRVTFSNEVYVVRVKDAPKNGPKRTSLFFGFEAPNYYVITDNEKADPYIKELKVPSDNAIIESLKPFSASSLKYHDRIHYYDLPGKWFSYNYFTRYDNDMSKGDIYQKVVNDIKKLKPYGTVESDISSPLMFSLDDIVLIDNASSQIINDKNGRGVNRAGLVDQENINPLYPFKSRVKILYFDTENFQLKLYSTADASDAQTWHDGSIFRFYKDTKNLLIDITPTVRSVIFCHEFYDVTDKRTVADATFRLDKGHILGARAAKLDDTDVHIKKSIRHNDGIETVHSPEIGDFDLHYFRFCGFKDQKDIDSLVVYWSCFVGLDPAPQPGHVGGPVATDADVKNAISIGTANCMNHWNKKNYEFHAYSKNANTSIIKPLFIFDANESFKLNAPAILVAFNIGTFMTSNDLVTAVDNSIGGKPNSIVIITQEAKGSWFCSTKFNTYSLMSLRIKTVKNDPDRFEEFPYNEFSDPDEYGCLAMAHEIGHATGQVDDYLQIGIKIGNKTANVPLFGQFGCDNAGKSIKNDNTNFINRIQGSDPYDIPHDPLTMMVKNGPVRMRQIWRFVNWINNETKPAKTLNRFLGNEEFKIVYPRAKMEYFRETGLKPGEKVDPWWFHSATIDIDPTNPTKKCNAYFYKWLDETRIFKRGMFKSDINFDYILVLRPLFSIAFITNTPAAPLPPALPPPPVPWPTDLHKKSWVENFYEQFKAKGVRGKKGKFAFFENGNTESKVLLRILPGFDFYAEGSMPLHNEFNFRIEVKWNSNDPINYDVANRKITLGSGIGMANLLRYIFNVPHNEEPFKKNHLSFITGWLNGRGIGTYTIEEI